MSQIYNDRSHVTCYTFHISLELNLVPLATIHPSTVLCWRPKAHAQSYRGCGLEQPVCAKTDLGEKAYSCDYMYMSTEVSRFRCVCTNVGPTMYCSVIFPLSCSRPSRMFFVSYHNVHEVDEGLTMVLTSVDDSKVSCRSIYKASSATQQTFPANRSGPSHRPCTCTTWDSITSACYRCMQHVYMVMILQCYCGRRWRNYVVSYYQSWSTSSATTIQQKLFSG